MCEIQPQFPTTHEHHLEVFKSKQRPRNLLRSIVGSFKNGIPNRMKLAQEDVPDLEEEDEGLLAHKYGACREIIGSGGSSTVWVSHKRDSITDGKLFAIKGFRRHPNGDEKDFKRRLEDEHQILTSLHHQNIIRPLDLVQDDGGGLFEVLEFCEAGDMHSLLIQRGKLRAIEADCFFKQLLSGVNYMHEQGIAHRDLKPENLVLTAKGVLKIADFGESERFRVAGLEICMLGGVCGSSPYISPEVYIEGRFDARAADVWSTGVIYMVMRYGRYLWVTAGNQDTFYTQYVLDRRTEKGYIPIEDLGRLECSNVLYSILDPKPDRRLTASQFLRTEWVRSIQLCQAVPK